MIPGLNQKTKSCENTKIEDIINKPVYVFGRNEECLELYKLNKNLTIIDDFFELETWKNIKVIPIQKVPRGATIVNCSSSISPSSTAARGLSVTGNVVPYSEIQSALPSELRPARFVRETRDDYNKHQKKWDSLYNQLYDSFSKQTLKDLLAFRLSGDYSHMKSYETKIDQQYLDKAIRFHQETYVDVGGFNGDTAINFINSHPDCKHIHVIEPSKENLAAARKNIAETFPHQEINWLNVALSNKNDTLRFRSSIGSSCHIDQEGESVVKATTLDELNLKDITYIKMDIEGAELNAIRGARDTIRFMTPKLAIAVYHSPSDFWKIYQEIISLNPHYKILLRHYTEGWSETIMYFLNEHDIIHAQLEGFQS